ncbi:unnamed protein product [Mytilus edulis]|uniref:Uncharacterized protein n=1 Tax=Mytilus edulis TaxID=6550 RepID=A0A8S3VNZ0_MYTED|nr:unnamed protein product [Mytilus edulis]
MLESVSEKSNLKKPSNIARRDFHIDTCLTDCIHHLKNVTQQNHSTYYGSQNSQTENHTACTTDHEETLTASHKHGDNTRRKDKTRRSVIDDFFRVLLRKCRQSKGKLFSVKICLPLRVKSIAQKTVQTLKSLRDDECFNFVLGKCTLRNPDGSQLRNQFSQGREECLLDLKLGRRLQSFILLLKISTSVKVLSSC